MIFFFSVITVKKRLDKVIYFPSVEEDVNEILSLLTTVIPQWLKLALLDFLNGFNLKFDPEFLCLYFQIEIINMARNHYAQDYSVV